MSTATNGAATVAPAEEAYAAAQRAGIVAEDRTEREKESWRRVATIEALALALLLVAVVVLAFKQQHDVLVYHETNQTGLSYSGEAQQSLTPDNLAIEGQLGAFVKAVRDIPGMDFALVDRNVALALLMTADTSPAHAHTDMLNYFRDDANNPKKLWNEQQLTRTVLDPVIASPIGNTRSWNLTWAEETNAHGVKTRKLYAGTVTIAEPRIPTDRQKAELDPAGVVIVQYELHI